MEAVYEQMKKANKNNTEELTRWMTNAKLVENTTEDQLRELFETAPTPKDIPFPFFMEALTKFAQDHKLSIEELTTKLIAAGQEALKITMGQEAGKALERIGL